MTTGAKTDLDKDVVQQKAEIAVQEATRQPAPVVQRLSSHRGRFMLAIKELESERLLLLARLEQLRRHAEAADRGLSIHLQDIEDTLKLYESGLHSGPANEPAPASQMPLSD